LGEIAMTITVLNPKAADDQILADPTERLASLDGAVIGFVDNSKLNADLFIQRVSAGLEKEFGAKSSLVIRKLAPKELLSDTEYEKLRACDAVIQCFGDCGTSTSMNVVDAIRFEKDGTPTANVFSTAFSSAARQQAQGKGLGALPLVEIPHPMHTASDAQVADRADQVVSDIVSRLTDGASIQRQSGTVDLPERIDLDAASLDDQELFHANGWTDGLPVVPPTAEKVAAMVAAGGRDASECLGRMPPRMREATVEKIAINAVMAGCEARAFPVVLAACEALLEEDCKLFGVQTATNQSTPMLLINGPAATVLDVNSKGNVLGPGWRSNATIGRAVRLVCRNVGGEIPLETDMATQGQPGKYGLCIAEAEDETPWEPFHVEKGHKADTNTVTVFGGVAAPHNVFTYGCETGQDIMEHFIGAMTALGNNNIIFPSGPMIVLSPEHAGTLARDGYTKDKMRAEIFEKARIPLATLPEKTQKGLLHRRSNWFATVGDDAHIGISDRPEDIVILVAGGPGIHSVFIPTSFSLRPIIKEFTLAE
jgi:hypothetical protein